MKKTGVITRYLATDDIYNLVDCSSDISVYPTKTDSIDVFSGDEGLEVVMYEVTFKPIKSGVITVTNKTTLK